MSFEMESIPENNTSILIVDDEPGILLSMKATMVSSGMPEPALVSDSRRVLSLLEKHRFSLVLLDLIMPDKNGLELLQEIKEEFPETECVVLTGIDEASSAVQAIKYGAYDYIVKPITIEKLTIIVDRALERYNLKRGLSLFETKQSFSNLHRPYAFNSMVAEDESMALVFHQAEAVALSDYSVVISGESGTGKEVLARIIHFLSSRSDSTFLAVNMGAFTGGLFESEFFGHTKGAYTNAVSDKSGFFEEADGGTLFLDEITELELPLQSKLLRVIQEKELYRLGSPKARNFDVRFISATNKDINDEIKNGKFRADLFYRLNMYHINIPPLRSRRKDILPLSKHFIKKYATINNKKINSLSKKFKNQLLQYNFPGNVRELENIIASSILMAKDKILEPSSAVNLEKFQFDKVDDMDEVNPESDFPTLADVEKKHIKKAMDKAEGDRQIAAMMLGVNASTVYRKLKKYNL